MSDIICGIYKITSPTGKVYIGQSVNINNRWMSYKNIYKDVSSQPRLYNSLIKYGSDNHLFEVIEECQEIILNERERYWQEHYNVLCEKNGLNCKLTKTKDKSGKVSESTLIKMSNSQKGDKHRNWKIKKHLHPMYGRKHSDEAKLKISLAQKGVKKSKDFIERMSGKNNPNYGVSISEKQKYILSEKAKERYRFNNHPRNKGVIDMDTGFYYDNAVSCSVAYNIKYPTLKSKLNRNKTEKRFKYI